MVRESESGLPVEPVYGPGALADWDPAERLGEPGKYPDPQRFERGQSVPVPESVGIALDLSVDVLLDGEG
ncbi:hypothetical protein [Streptomyces sp. NPDC002276]